LFKQETKKQILLRGNVFAYLTFRLMGDLSPPSFLITEIHSRTHTPCSRMASYIASGARSAPFGH
jgi:hypothetical protein